MSKYKSESVRAIIQDGSRVLVEWLPHKGISFLPGGRRESNEDLRQTLERELREELAGVTTVVGSYRGKIGHRWPVEDGEDSCLNHFFDAQISSKSLVKAGEASREIRWLDVTTSELFTLKPPSLQKLLLSGSDSLGQWDIIDAEQ